MGKFTEKDAEIFRREARDCRDQADKASDPADRERWLNLAEEWAKLAKIAEQPRRFWAGLLDKPDKEWPAFWRWTGCTLFDQAPPQWDEN
jgi:hypothetical protein